MEKELATVTRDIQVLEGRKQRLQKRKEKLKDAIQQQNSAILAQKDWETQGMLVIICMFHSVCSYVDTYFVGLQKHSQPAQADLDDKMAQTLPLRPGLATLEDVCQHHALSLQQGCSHMRAVRYHAIHESASLVTTLVAVRSLTLWISSFLLGCTPYLYAYSSVYLHGPIPVIIFNCAWCLIKPLDQ